MDLLVNRYERSSNDKGTVGEISINGLRECFTLEDKVREIPGQPASAWKISGVTAIPTGRYQVTLVWSPKHQCRVPLVNGVEGFSAIEIHWGNRDVDTEGCLLLGRTHVPGEDFIGESNLAWDAFMPKLEKAFGVERASVDARGKPVNYEQVAPAEPVWVTYVNNLPPLSDPSGTE